MSAKRVSRAAIAVAAAVGTLAACGGNGGTSASSSARLHSLEAMAVYRTNYPGSTLQRSDPGRENCTGLFQDPAYAARSLTFDGNTAALLAFYERRWKSDGWRLERGPQGRQPNGDTLLAYEKQFRGWTGGVQINTTGTSYTLSVTVLSPCSA